MFKSIKNFLDALKEESNKTLAENLAVTKGKYSPKQKDRHFRLRFESEVPVVFVS